MNRKKKMNNNLKARVKKMNAKANPSHKPKYVSKAVRAQIALDEAVQSELVQSEEIQAGQEQTEQETVQETKQEQAPE
jgi:hypothetical protein